MTFSDHNPCPTQTRWLIAQQISVWNGKTCAISIPNDACFLECARSSLLDSSSPWRIEGWRSIVKRWRSPDTQRIERLLRYYVVAESRRWAPAAQYLRRKIHPVC